MGHKLGTTVISLTIGNEVAKEGSTDSKSASESNDDGDGWCGLDLDCK